MSDLPFQFPRLHFTSLGVWVCDGCVCSSETGRQAESDCSRILASLSSSLSKVQLLR